VSVARIAFQACAFNRAAIYPSLDSTTCERLRTDYLRDRRWTADVPDSCKRRGDLGPTRGWCEMRDPVLAGGTNVGGSRGEPTETLGTTILPACARAARPLQAGRRGVCRPRGRPDRTATGLGSHQRHCCWHTTRPSTYRPNPLCELRDLVRLPRPRVPRGPSRKLISAPLPDRGLFRRFSEIERAAPRPRQSRAPASAIAGPFDCDLANSSIPPPADLAPSSVHRETVSRMTPRCPECWSAGCAGSGARSGGCYAWRPILL
jgi:hypothetical protein